MRAVRTKSRGVAVPLRVDFLLNRTDLIDALCYRFRNHDLDTETLPTLSRDKALEVVKDSLYDHGGINLWMWTECAPDMTTLHEWGIQTVERLFGEILRAGGEEA